MSNATAPPLNFEYEERLTDHFREVLSTLSPEAQSAWREFIAFARLPSGPKPTHKFLAAAREHVERIGAGEFERVTALWIDFAVAMSRLGEDEVRRLEWWKHMINASGFLTTTTAPILRAVVHARRLVEGPEDVVRLERLAAWAAQTIPQYGPRHKPLALSCFHALAARPASDGIAALSRLRARIKRPAIRKSLDGLIGAAADAHGVDTGALADAATPKFGLDAATAAREEAVGEYTARLTVTAPGKSSLTWRSPGGKEQRAVPAAVKAGFAERLKAVKKGRKALNDETGAQRERIESFYREDRCFGYAAFAKTFHAHPLLGWFSRKLIWAMTAPGQDAVLKTLRHYDGAWRDAAGAELSPRANWTVSLWHPVVATLAEVQAWRDHCYARELVQPFKQAFREVYHMTPAKRETGSYSTRMAAHIVEQGKLNALCRARSWQKTLLGPWDGGDGTYAKLALPAYGLTAEYYLGYIDEERTSGRSYVGTDRLRFRDASAPWDAPPRPLAEIAPTVFSEVMRDADLFISVAGVANDPEWVDSGERSPEQVDYWRRSSFGKLMISAEIRRVALARLLPRLKIAGVTELSGQCVLVRGRRHTYEIHIGTANVRIADTERYVSIARAQSSAAKTRKVYLPFEGDETLSLIISKAFLLAADDTIDDPTILAQL